MTDQNLITSGQFASSMHSGADWRETAKKVLDDLQAAITPDSNFNFGFIYISDKLAREAASIFDLFRSVLKIKNWVGSVGIGVYGADNVSVDEPAISAMIGRFDEDDFCLFRNPQNDAEPLRTATNEWLDANDAMLVLTHIHPGLERDIKSLLQDIETKTGGFLIGGVSICRPDNLPPPDKIAENAAAISGINLRGGIDCVAFSNRIKIASSLSQGCIPVGNLHTITKSHDNMIYELDSGLPQSIFEDELRALAVEKLGKNPDEILVESDEIPPEFRSVFSGEIMAAFPIAESDGGDMMVRSILGIEDDGSMLVGHNVMNGERIMFMHRNDHTLQADLTKRLIDLRKRVENETGFFKPKGGIFISCAARAYTESGQTNNAEIKLIREILGEFPLTGFFAGGEIKGARLYGYTGILTLFL